MPDLPSRSRRSSVRRAYQEDSGDESTDEDDILPNWNDGNAGDDSTGEVEDTKLEPNETVDANKKKVQRKKSRRRQSASSNDQMDEGPFSYVAADTDVDEKSHSEGDHGKACPHCKKNFSTPSRLRYHLEKLVCRKAEKSASVELEAVPVKKRGKGRPKQAFRGNQDDRTCPRCKRVFTSVLGCQYHCGKSTMEPIIIAA
jgi:hypothetical protein